MFAIVIVPVPSPTTRTQLRWPRAAMALAACAFGFACREATHPGPRAPASSPGSSGDFPPFPAGDTPPTLPEVAAMLASGLPAPDRPTATRLLTEDILSRDLRDLPDDPSAQPSARAIVHAAYDTLVRSLGQLARDHRLARVTTIACTRRGDRLTRRATAVAVARYVAARGRPRSILVVGYLDEASPYLAMTPDQLQAEADRIERDLAAYERDAQADRDCYAPQRIALADGRLALEAARSGRFDPAIGAFYVFLRNAGDRPRRVDPTGEILPPLGGPAGKAVGVPTPRDPASPIDRR
jgi:hypothetical protein